MAISKNSSIDFAKIALEMRGIVERWYNAEIRIIDPNTRDQAWNMQNNTFSNSPASIIYTGKARIQPIREARTPDLGVTQGAIQSIRVQVPYSATLPLIRKGLQVEVTKPGEDAVLSSLRFTVRSAINSSYGWNRTIECDVDVKSVANGGS
jgi:hypothetical protein